jgi:hypothetical protein
LRLVQYILEKHIRVASTKQPSLTQKRVSPHRLRHSCAMYTLHATGDIRKVSLWLGHATLQSTEVYLRADPTEKLEAMASLIPPPYGVVVSDRRISYSLCFDPNRSPVMRRPKPLNWRFRGSVCRPTPHINGRRIFAHVHCFHAQIDLGRRTQPEHRQTRSNACTTCPSVSTSKPRLTSIRRPLASSTTSSPPHPLCPASSTATNCCAWLPPAFPFRYRAT